MASESPVISSGPLEKAKRSCLLLDLLVTLLLLACGLFIFAFFAPRARSVTY